MGAGFQPRLCARQHHRSRLESRSHEYFTRSEMNFTEVNNDHNQ